jgi:hypothetical protein
MLSVVDVYKLYYAALDHVTYRHTHRPATSAHAATSCSSGNGHSHSRWHKLANGCVNGCVNGQCNGGGHYTAALQSTHNCCRSYSARATTATYRRRVRVTYCCEYLFRVLITAATAASAASASSLPLLLLLLLLLHNLYYCSYCYC